MTATVTLQRLPRSNWLYMATVQVITDCGGCVSKESRLGSDPLKLAAWAYTYAAELDVRMRGAAA